MQPPRFMPFLFDCREAWENAISDPDYNPDMHFPQFMQLYKAYRDRALRGHKPSMHRTKPSNVSILPSPPQKKVVPPVRSPEPAGMSQLLSQHEIDSLINQMNQGSPPRQVDPPKESMKKPDSSFSGLMSQDDIDELMGNKKAKPADDFGLLSQDDLDALMGGR